MQIHYRLNAVNQLKTNQIVNSQIMRLLHKTCVYLKLKKYNE